MSKFAMSSDSIARIWAVVKARIWVLDRLLICSEVIPWITPVDSPLICTALRTPRSSVSMVKKLSLEM